MASTVVVIIIVIIITVMVASITVVIIVVIVVIVVIVIIVVDRLPVRGLEELSTAVETAFTHLASALGPGDIHHVVTAHQLALLHHGKDFPLGHLNRLHPAQVRVFRHGPSDRGRHVTHTQGRFLLNNPALPVNDDLQVTIFVFELHDKQHDPFIILCLDFLQRRSGKPAFYRGKHILGQLQELIRGNLDLSPLAARGVVLHFIHDPGLLERHEPPPAGYASTFMLLNAHDSAVANTASDHLQQGGRHICDLDLRLDLTNHTFRRDLDLKPTASLLEIDLIVVRTALTLTANSRDLRVRKIGFNDLCGSRRKASVRRGQGQRHGEQQKGTTTCSDRS